ncbi:hypothetical protein Tco_0553777 [Tanacetum coccineum]
MTKLECACLKGSNTEPLDEPKRVCQALRNPAWVEALQERNFFSSNCKRPGSLVEFTQGHRAIDVKVCLYSKDLEKPLGQDGDAADVDEHIYDLIDRIFDVTSQHKTRYQCCAVCDVQDLLTKGFDAGTGFSTLVLSIGMLNP